MSEYFRGALFYFLCFLSGCAFATLVFGWSLHSHRIESKNQANDAQSILRRAFGFGLRQLAFLLVLSACSFALVGGVLSMRSTPQNSAENSSGSTLAQPLPSGESLSSSAPTPDADAARIVGIPLPAEVQTVTDASIIGSSSQQLQRLVSEVDAQSQLGEVEVLMWRGATDDKAKSIMAQVTKSLQNAKWIYRETKVDAKTKTQGGVHEFVAANTSEKKIVTGFWLVTDQFLLLSWGEAKPKDGV